MQKEKGFVYFIIKVILGSFPRGYVRSSEIRFSRPPIWTASDASPRDHRRSQPPENPLDRARSIISAVGRALRNWNRNLDSIRRQTEPDLLCLRRLQWNQ
jgi:hypothetical protein